MRSTRALPALPAAVVRALHKLGQDLSAARRRRRLPMALVAERAFVSMGTMVRVEKGDPRVSMGVYATVLFLFGMADRLTEIADASRDTVGLALEDEELPKRVRRSARRPGVRGHEP